MHTCDHKPAPFHGQDQYLVDQKRFEMALEVI